MLYDSVLVLIVIVVGFGLALKADKWWGYILVAIAVVWGFMLVKPYL